MSTSVSPSPHRKSVSEAVSTAQTSNYPGLPAFVGAAGCWFSDQSGKRYLDCTAGSGALNLGHNHPRVVAASTRQLGRLIHTGSMLHADVRDQLVERLGEFSPFERCAILLTVIGTEAIEAALKVARACTGRRAVVAFHNAYHGKSSGALSVTWRERYKQFSPMPEAVVYFSPYPIAHSRTTQDHAEACLQALQTTIERMQHDGNPPAAIILEPAQVTEGILIPGDDFLKNVIELAHAAQALVIFDEIYTGFGRCGTPFYSSRPGLLPDLLVVGKSLGNGFPISAVIGPPEVVNHLPSGIHTSTFAGHPVACATACEVIDVMNELQPWHAAIAKGKQLLASLDEMAANTQFITSVRGEGLMLGFDCVDQEGRPYPQLTEAFAMLALQKGLLLHYGGFENCTIKLTPPLTADQESIDFLTDALFDTADDIALEVAR